MNIPDISKFKTVHVVVVGLTGLVVVLVVFQVGVFVGYSKAMFAEKMAGEYSRVYGGRPGMPDMMGSFSGKKDIPGGHGATGRVIEINLPVIEVADSNNIEKHILTSSSTLVRNMRDAVSVEAIKLGDIVVIVGSPNTEGQIEARLIRLMAPPPQALASSTIK